MVGAQWADLWGLQLDAGFPASSTRWLQWNWRALVEADEFPATFAHARWSLREQTNAPATVAATTVERDFLGLRFHLAHNEHFLRAESGPSGACAAFRDDDISFVEAWGPEPHISTCLVLFEVFARRGWLQLHGAALRWPARGDETHLLLGLSGSGKSCAVQQALHEGALTLGDDLFWLRMPELMLVPRRPFFRLNPDAFDLMPWLPRSRALPEADGKWRLECADLATEIQPPAVPDRLVLLPATPRPPTPVDKARAVWEALNLPLTAPARAWHQRAVAELVRLPVGEASSS